MRKRINQISELTTCISLLMLAPILLAGCQSIQAAAREGNLKEVKRQLAWGVNVNAETLRMRIAPLHEAAGNGHTKIVKLLLEKGADVNIRDEGGATPLHWATRNGHTEVMRILLENGADTRQRGTGCGSPLEWAARKGQIQIVEILLAYGADINYEKPLHAAVGAGHVGMVEYMVARGADVDKRNDGGCPPLHYTFRGQDLDMSRAMKKIRRILQANGADPTITCDRHNHSMPSKGTRRKIQKGYLVKLLTGDLE